MRSTGIALIGILLASGAQAEVLVTPVTVQKGLFLDQECKPETLPEDSGLDECRCEATIVAPQISGVGDAKVETTINQYLRERVEDSEKCEGALLGKEDNGEKAPKPKDPMTQFNVSYEDVFQADGVISLMLSYYAFSGGAHGGRMIEGVVANLKDGKIYGVAELLDMEHATLINQEIHKQLAAKPEGEVFEEVVQDTTYEYIKDEDCIGCTLTLSKDGLVVTFQQYEVGPYASGNIAVTLPPEVIADEAIQKVYAKKE